MPHKERARVRPNLDLSFGRPGQWRLKLVPPHSAGMCEFVHVSVCVWEGMSVHGYMYAGVRMHVCMHTRLVLSWTVAASRLEPPP